MYFLQNFNRSKTRF